MDEKETAQEIASTTLSNQQSADSNENTLNNIHPKIESLSASNKDIESMETSIHDQTFHDMTNGMSDLSMNNTTQPNRPNSMRYRPHSTHPSQYFQQYYPSNMTSPDSQAQLVAFTPPLMSIQFSNQESQIYPRNNYPQRSHMSNRSNEQTYYSSAKKKSETKVPQPQYYVDSFASNFSDKPSSTSNNSNKPKAKHVTFQESETITGSSRLSSDSIPFSPSTPIYQPTHHFYQHHYPNQQYSYNNFYPYHSGMMTNSRYATGSRRMNMMSATYGWPPRLYNPHQQASYVQPSYQQHQQQKQLYDPNKPKSSSTCESQHSSKVIRNITPKHRKKPKQTDSNETSTVSTPESIPSHPFTILRKPSADTELPPISLTEEPPTSLSIEDPSNTSSEKEQIISSSSQTNAIPSIASHILLSILQSPNCISTLNEFAQQNNLTLNYEHSSVSPSIFTCTVTINSRQFPSSSPCSTKNEAQKLACDQALRILYRESRTQEQTQPEFSNKHDYIAHRSLTKFQDLNVNELLLGRKTLACMLMVIDGQFEQASVISIGTGNSCLDETNLSYADDGKVLHDCHAEILARRGLIRFLFEQIKQCKDNQSSIFQYDSTIDKYQLQENITFHMYISSLPCGNAALTSFSNSIRYKQGQIEGTILASTSPIKYPIKSCSDKISRWSILGIQGGLLIYFLTKPIYLETITIACDTTFDRNHVKYSLSEHLNEHFSSLPSPFLFHIPDIDCPKTKSFQYERRVAKLQTNAFAWNITQPDRTELLEPMTGKLKIDRSISSLSKYNFFVDFTNYFQTTLSQDAGLSYKTYQQAKQLNKTYLRVKDLLSTAFQTESTDANVSWLSKSDQLEQFSIE
ncbi:hypothetical protein I4U23_030510 [Adineta vaga]|nr:hypothetical protein I4U23_030510 [Adineta vaga]